MGLHHGHDFFSLHTSLLEMDLPRRQFMVVTTSEGIPVEKMSVASRASLSANTKTVSPLHDVYASTFSMYVTRSVYTQLRIFALQHSVDVHVDYCDLGWTHMVQSTWDRILHRMPFQSNAHRNHQLIAVLRRRAMAAFDMCDTVRWQEMAL